MKKRSRAAALVFALGAAFSLAGEARVAFAAEPEAGPGAELKLSALTYRLAPDLVACGQPSRADLQAIKAAGYRTVLNLRTDGEKGSLEGESALLSELGLREIRIPFAWETLDEKIVDAFRRAVKDPANRPLVVHCASSNRVGTLFAILAVVDDGKSLEEAEKIGREAGMTKDEAKATLRKYVEGWKAKAPKG